MTQPVVYPQQALNGNSTVMSAVEITLLVGTVGLIAYLIYKSAEQERAIDREIVEKQGVGKALEYEGGKAGIRVLERVFSK